jgi:hypothetical protein
MQSDVTNATTTRGDIPAEPPTILKRIGSTTFVVAVHYSRRDGEPAQEIMKRLIQQEVDKIA